MGVQEVIQKEMDMVLLAPTDPRHTIASGLADTLLAITESSSLIPTASHLDLLQDQQYQHYFAKVQELYTEKKTMNPSNDKIPLGAKQEAFDYLITNDRLFEEEAFTIDIPALRFGNAWTFGEKTIRVAQYATIPSSETTKTVYLRDEHT